MGNDADRVIMGNIAVLLKKVRKTVPEDLLATGFKACRSCPFNATPSMTRNFNYDWVITYCERNDIQLFAADFVKDQNPIFRRYSFKRKQTHPL